MKDLTFTAGSKLGQIYDGIYKLYKDGMEIPVTEYRGYTITFRESWTEPFSIYSPGRVLIAKEGTWWTACAETVAFAHDLEEFPYDVRPWEEGHEYYSHAIDLQLSGTGYMIETFRDISYKKSIKEEW